MVIQTQQFIKVCCSPYEEMQPFHCNDFACQLGGRSTLFLLYIFHAIRRYLKPYLHYGVTIDQFVGAA